VTSAATVTARTSIEFQTICDDLDAWLHAVSTLPFTDGIAPTRSPSSRSPGTFVAAASRKGKE
jgi:hypothetical protein